MPVRDDLDDVNWDEKSTIPQTGMARQRERQHGGALLPGSWWWEKCDRLPSAPAVISTPPSWSLFLHSVTINTSLCRFLCLVESTRKLMCFLNILTLVNGPHLILFCTLWVLGASFQASVPKWEIATHPQDFRYDSLTLLFIMDFLLQFYTMLSPLHTQHDLRTNKDYICICGMDFSLRTSASSLWKLVNMDSNHATIPAWLKVCSILSQFFMFQPLWFWMHLTMLFPRSLQNPVHVHPSTQNSPFHSSFS